MISPKQTNVAMRLTRGSFAALVFAVVVAFSGATKTNARAASMPIILAQTTDEATAPHGKKGHHRLYLIGGAVAVVVIAGGVVFFMRGRKKAA